MPKNALTHKQSLQNTLSFMESYLKMFNRLPVLIVGYARSENILNQINTCLRENVEAIYVSLDGARTTEINLTQIELIRSIREISKTTATPINIWKKEMNLGPGAAVITAIDWVFSHEEAAIVLEDDLEVDGELFRYMRANIEILRLKNEYLILSGTKLQDDQSNEITLSNIPVIWGWATTKSKWAITRNLILNSSIDLKKIRNLRRRLYWLVGRKKALEGMIDAWDVPLAAAMFAEGYECLLPPTNLVTNNGFDNVASHTKEKTWPLGLPRYKLKVELPVVNPSENKKNDNNKFLEKEILNLNLSMLGRNLITLARLNMLNQSSRNLESLESKVIRGWNSR